VQASADVPEPVLILVTDRLHERFVELVEAVSATVPPNPFRGATVTVDIPETPVFTDTVVGVATIVKSWT
jgi:hypothetical protein